MQLSIKYHLGKKSNRNEIQILLTHKNTKEKKKKTSSSSSPSTLNHQHLQNHNEKMLLDMRSHQKTGLAWCKV